MEMLCRWPEAIQWPDDATTKCIALCCIELFIEMCNLCLKGLKGDDAIAAKCEGKHDREIFGIAR